MLANNVTLTIAEGASARSRTWKNKDYTWSELVERLKESERKRTTLKEFLKYSKQDQGRIKDVGGYVGGYLRAGRRSPQNVVHRQLLTLDVDNTTDLDFFDTFTFMYSCAAVVHGTHKHTKEAPRLRLLIPLDREASPEEYQAIARKVAGSLGIDQFDNTTFETNRLMFWPSHPADQAYYFEEQKGECLNADEILSSYADWRDSSLWPTADKQVREIGDKVKQQADPTTKKGIIGAFCRTYTISEAIEAFLPEEYLQGEHGRYTYSKGSTANGLVVYNDTFAFSHHGTDPTSGQLCNAFDLVRIHKFGHLDERENSVKSLRAMEELAVSDKEVKLTIAREGIADAKELFSDMPEEVQDVEWMENLEIDSKGGYLSTANNINLIYKNDPVLKEAFKFNSFDSRHFLMKSTPWRKIEEPEPMRNVDYSGLRNYIECRYHISSSSKIDDGLVIEAERLKFHPIKDYLEGLEWDGVQRIDTLLSDFFGAPETEYTAAVMRKWMVAAISRIFRPGTKFDYVPVLVDPEQGSFKSTFVRILGKSWFSDTFTTLEGNGAFEQLMGAWIIEIGEMSAFKKSDIDKAKQFISKQVDQFRPAYGRTIEVFKRQCVFFGNTNNVDFLRDPSGNRRFWPIDVDRTRIKKSVIEDLEPIVDELWAEAMTLYRCNEKLHLNEVETEQAKEQQHAHTERDDRAGIIQAFLDRELPTDWDEKDQIERRQWLSSGAEAKNGVKRSVVCVAEIWYEGLGYDKELNKYVSREINDILRSLPEWRPRLNTSKSFKLYGTQKYYERI
jgi:putative DNA primase/helicase